VRLDGNGWDSLGPDGTAGYSPPSASPPPWPVTAGGAPDADPSPPFPPV